MNGLIKYVVCFSGGYLFVLVVIKVVCCYGCENVVLLNYDIYFIVEDCSIKCFKE